MREQQLNSIDYIEISRKLYHLWSPFYNDPIRKYHNVDHIHMILAYAKEFDVELSMEQTIAILFHDAVYIPALSSELGVEKSNEKASAAVVTTLSNEIEEIVGEVDFGLVRLLIMSTADHTKREPYIGDNVVVDLDLYCAYKNYESNISKIKDEYGSLPDHEWVVGRCNFLKKMITADTLFQTKKFESFIDPYKEAMLKELNELTQCKKHIKTSLFF